MNTDKQFTDIISQIKEKEIDSKQLGEKQESVLGR